MGISAFDVGGCNCSICKPCGLPGADLTLTWTMTCPGGAGTDSGVATLHDLGGGAWLSDCMNWPSTPFGTVKSGKLRIDCGIIDTVASPPKSGTRYKIYVWTATTCSGAPVPDTTLNYEHWDYDDGTSHNYGTIAMTAHTCSPLSITLVAFCTSAFVITP